MDDLISRKAMREAMYHEAMEKDSDEQKWNGGCWIRYKMFERVIGSLPSAQKTGKWIGNEFGECSVCGHKGCASDIWDRCEKYYCPNCGALLTDSVSEDVYPIEDAEW